MKHLKIMSLTISIVIFIGMFGAAQLRAQSDVWATAYYAGWQQGYNNTGYLPAQNVDYSAMTHIIHFALTPNSDGTLNDASNSVTAYNANELVTRAHAAGRKVLICVGGWSTDAGFRAATNATNRSKFIANLVNLMKTRGYDGVDIDWEPLAASDASQYVAFITELRTALDAISPRPLLAAATGWLPSTFAQLKDKFDQINIMTYDLAGAWSGWVTWHNSAITNGGFNFPSTGNPVPSADGEVNQYIQAGVPAAKLGIGIDFYGYVWSGGAGTPTGGATEPRQSWTTAPTVQSNVPYSTIMKNYYQPQYERWDSGPQAAYLSIDNTGSANDKFISYDNEITVQKKVEYARSKKIGGVIIWELGGGYRADMPAGQRDPLLQALKQALGTTTPPSDATPPVVSMTSPVHGSTISGTVTVSANASDDVGVSGVRFTIDGNTIESEDLTAPHNVSLNTTLHTNGSHTIAAIARDAAGNTSTASVSVTISNTTPDTTPPTVSVSSPTNGTTVSGTMAVSATAADNVGVVGVRFTIDGNTVGSEDLTSPYSVSLNTTSFANGNHAIAATARDAAGNSTTASVSVTISNTTPDTTPPTVSVSSPTNGATVAGTIAVSATASDNIKVVGVQFTLDGINLCAELTAIPYTYSWNTTQVSNGSHTLKTVARDAAGNQASTSLTITVANTTPPAGSNLIVYQDALQKPWINTSWNSTITFVSSEKVYSGSSSIKVVEKSWGALRLHSGPWGAPVDVSPSKYSSFSFAIYGGTSGLSLGVYFENDLNQSFPAITYIAIAKNQWRVMSFSMSQLNPNNQVVHRFVIQDMSGQTRTFYIDDIKFSTSSQSSPDINEPTNGISDINQNPESFGLQQNYPNPFNPSTMIGYTLNEEADVTLDVFNSLGQRVEVLVDNHQTAGMHQVKFNGSGLPSGIYFYRLTARPISGEGQPLVSKMKMILMK